MRLHVNLALRSNASTVRTVVCHKFSKIIGISMNSIYFLTKKQIQHFLEFHGGQTKLQVFIVIK